MEMETNRIFGAVIGRLIAGESLSREESYQAFCQVLNNQVSEMQQGAFLATLTAKGETAAEVAGGWQAVYEHDTRKVQFNEFEIVDNCGTGMDSFKTFNISTAASVVAAAGGLKVARHGARAITSRCGTVDMAERLGVDVECPVEVVANSVRQTGLGLFNGMSPEVHPMALGRILSQIAFGSPLNIAASLAHPAMPRIALRGVYDPSLLQPVAEVMREIGYTSALVVHGAIDGSTRGMDEASVCGTTKAVWLKDGKTATFEWRPTEFGLGIHDPEALAADSDLELAAVRMYRLLAGKEDQARTASVLFNAGLLFLAAGKVGSVAEGVGKANDLIMSGAALATLEAWVGAQNRDPRAGLAKLSALAKEAGDR